MNYFSLLRRVLKDALADKTRRRVSEQEVSTYCDMLVRTIRQSYEPEVIVAIDTGGSVPGELIAQALGVPVVHLTVSRNINIIRWYSSDLLPWRWIMSLYHHFLFQTSKPVVRVGFDIDVSGKRVLIVEDTIHTGTTIDVAINYLNQVHVSEIKIASLAYVSERKPDFSVLPQGNYSFPWSKDYNKSIA